MSLVQSFNMPYSILMLKSSPLPSYGTIKLIAGQIGKYELGYQKDVPFTVVYSVQVWLLWLKNNWGTSEKLVYVRYSN